MPSSISRAASFQPINSNIIAPESINELGLITSLSAYFGAVPCVASKTPYPSPMFDPGAIPSPPTCAAQVGEIVAVERSEEHTSELQSRLHLVCRLLLEKKKNTTCDRCCV